jgi:cell volume regulation protein A
MGPVALFLVAIAAIFLIGSIGEIVFQRTNVPDVIWLIFAGIVAGPVTGLVTREQLGAIAPYFAALTLVIVLFEGGSALKLDGLSQAAPRAGALAIAGFALSAIAVAATSWIASAIGVLPAGFTLEHGLLLGAILGGSSSIIVMPAMVQARVEPGVANLVSLESALTDALCVVGTSALTNVMLRAGGPPSGGPAVALIRSFGIVWLVLLRFFRGHEHAYPVTLAVLLLLYVLVDHLGGSAAMGILTVAVLLGNAKSLSKVLRLAEPVELDTDVRGFHRQVTFMVKSFFFVFIGAMLGPPWGLLALGVLLGGVLLAARVPAVELSTLGAGFSRPQRKLVVASLPRGMAAGVLATLPASRGVPLTESFPVVVFACVLTTILVFAVAFPLARRGMPAPAVDAPQGGDPSPASVPSTATSTLPSAIAASPADLESAPTLVDPPRT